MYKFLLVEGISTTDTPLFNNIDEQTSYFSNKVVKVIDDFFPPHYTNTLDLETIDINFNTDCNYVVLILNGKNYYYFINSVTYVNEGLIRINIVMDTIQTYMFDIDYVNALIERKTIKRWTDDGLINRKYIRENLFDGNKVLKDFKYYGSGARPYGWLVITKVKASLTGVNMTQIKKVDTTGQQLGNLSNGLQLYILPLLLYDSSVAVKDIYIMYKDITGSIIPSIQSYSDYVYALYNAVSDPDTIQVQYIADIPSSGTIGQAFFEENNTTYLLVEYMNPNINITSENTQQLLLQINSINLYDKINEMYDFRFTNDSEITEYNYHQIPQLLDENYIEVSYGEVSEKTSYPLSKLVHTTIYLHYICDLFTCSRAYYISEEIGNSNTLDKYNTMITCINDNQFTMVNDNFKNYVSGNIGSFVNATADVVSTFIPIVKTASTIKRLRYRGKPTKKVRKVIKGTTQAIEEGATSDELAEFINNYFAPKTLRQNGYASLGQILHSMVPRLQVSIIPNIEAIGAYYESVGWLVNEFKQGSPIEQNRQIYNYVQCSDINLRLTMLSPEDQLEDIISRYEDGIRYWNVDNMETLGLKLGQILVYNNREVI